VVLPHDFGPEARDQQNQMEVVVRPSGPGSEVDRLVDALMKAASAAGVYLTLRPQ
jgi:hypothetical protein